MARVKKPKKVGPVQKFARRIIQGLLQLVFYSMSTLRYPKQAPDIEFPCVMAVFHDELLPLVYFYGNNRCGAFASIASQNHFGYSIAKVMENYQYEVALGSPSRGGKDAFFQLIRAARAGKSVAFTVDGSRGPRHEMKQGAIILARKSGLPLYLVRASFSGWRIESTWDKFKIPRPFSEVKFASERFPLENYADKDAEEALKAAELRLQKLQEDDYRATR